MRTPIFLGATLLVLALSSPALLMAQFQSPGVDELKMTSDPKAPGASAVYLYREEIADDHSHLYSWYERVKILTEKGKELATVRIPYQRGEFKVASIKGRTIHSDGTVIPLSVKPEDLVDFKSMNYRENTIVFTMPAVEAGSILEYRLQLLYDQDVVFTPHWNIQQPFYVHKAHYSFRPGGGTMTNSMGETLDRLTWSSTSPLIDVEHEKGSYIADVVDIPPLPNEEWMPPLNTVDWSVAFYYTSASSGADFWSTQGDRWADDAERFMGSPDASKSDTLKSGTLKKAVDSLVSAGDTDEVKARKIYAAVVKLDNLDFSSDMSDAELKNDKLSQIASAEDVWTQQSGNGNAIALLYAALARAAGLQAWPMKVVNRRRAIFNADYWSMSQLDDIVVVLVIGGKDIYVDPGEKMCPFGSLQWEHELAGGIRITATGSAIAITPAAAYTQNGIERQAELTLDEQGKVSGTARYTLTGAEALYWRQLALENDETEVKKQFIDAIRNNLPQGVDAEMDYFVGLDDYESSLIAVVDVSGSMGSSTGGSSTGGSSTGGSSAGSSAGNRVILPGLFFEAGVKHPFVSANKRITPIDLHYGEQDQDEVTYQLPEGLSVESAPKSADVTLPDYATLRIDSAAANTTLEVIRAFARNIVLFDPNDYAGLHDFYQKVAAADQQQIVLTRADAAKEN